MDKQELIEKLERRVDNLEKMIKRLEMMGRDDLDPIIKRLYAERERWADTLYRLMITEPLYKAAR